MSADERGRSSYLDLLISTLMEHEKNLDGLIERLEKIYENLSASREEVSPKVSKAIVAKGEGEPAGARPETLIYMRIKIDRPADEVVKIIETLKE